MHRSAEKNASRASARTVLKPIHRVFNSLVIGLCTLTSGVSVANDPVPPQDPAGRVGKDLLLNEERFRDRQPSIELPVMVEEESAPAVGQDEPLFILKGVRFSRSNILTQEELAGVIRPWLGREVSFQTLQFLLGKVNALYRTRDNYTSVAVFPEQSIENGIVTVRLVEGSVGELVFEGNSYTSDEYLKQWIRMDRHLSTVDVEVLEREIQFYNRVHSRQLQAELRAGKSFGLTDIVVRVPESAQNAMNVYLDNYGYESTGEAQLSALYQRERLFRAGDWAKVYALASTGLKSLSAIYSTALGTSGWRLGGTVQYTDTEIKEGEFSTLQVTGDSLRYSLDTSYLIYSGTDFWLHLLGTISNTRSENQVAGEDLSDYQTSQYQLGGQFDWLGDQWQLSGRLVYGIANSKEKILGGSRKVSLINPQATFIYNFERPFYALTTIQAQFASEEAIPGAVSFSIGGPTSIRGYKPGLVSGDSGWYQQLELHYNGFNYGDFAFDLYGFYDHGEVESLNPSQTLESAGLGLSINWGPWGSLDLVAASSLKEVVPNQDSGQVYARITCRCLN